MAGGIRKCCGLCTNCQARNHYDNCGVKFLTVNLNTMARDLQVPLSIIAGVIVPNLTASQKTAIYKVLHYVLCSAPLRAWERQAYNRFVRVVCSRSRKLHTVFDRQVT